MVFKKITSKRKETPLDEFAHQLLAANLPPNSQEARKWMYDRAREIHQINTGDLFRDPERTITDVNKILPGKMYMFRYDPIGKATLSYYDILPLVFPVERYRDGFLGINFHYLHPKLRMVLLDRLKPFKNNNKFDTTTRIRISYNLVNNFAKLHLVKPTLHKYLFSQFRSKILLIHPTEWDVAAMLPVERFIGENKYNVYKESREQFIHPGYTKTVGQVHNDK